MFNPVRDQARQFFFDAWRKYREGQPLEGLETVAVEVALLHPEYHHILDDPERFLDRDYAPEAGQTNPFLHLSLHVAIEEQLSIDQPPGIVALYRQMASRGDGEHEALHVLLECLGETVWQAQRDGTAPDEAAYLARIRRAVSALPSSSRMGNRGGLASTPSTAARVGCANCTSFRPHASARAR